MTPDEFCKQEAADLLAEARKTPSHDDCYVEAAKRLRADPADLLAAFDKWSGSTKGAGGLIEAFIRFRESRDGR